MSNAKFDIVGPAVDDDVRRLIRRYGPAAVSEAVKQQTKSKRGVKAKPDWLNLDDILRQDAARWLDGGDPFKERGSRTIAKEMAADQPGQSYDATFDRIRKKLMKDRRYYTLVQAAWLSEDHYPYGAHLKALQALAEFSRNVAWAARLLSAQSSLADYSAKFGSPPVHLTMRQLEAAAARALHAEPAESGGNILHVLLGALPK